MLFFSSLYFGFNYSLRKSESLREQYGCWRYLVVGRTPGENLNNHSFLSFYFLKLHLILFYSILVQPLSTLWRHTITCFFTQWHKFLHSIWLRKQENERFKMQPSKLWIVHKVVALFQQPLLTPTQLTTMLDNASKLDTSGPLKGEEFELDRDCTVVLQGRIGQVSFWIQPKSLAS